MPAKLIPRKREHRPAVEQEQAAPVAQHPRSESDEDEPVETGRPHQAFVEREARKYWEDMVQPGSLVKPEQQELRAAARPILLRALRNRGDVRFLPPTVKAHMAVNIMHMHAADSKVIPGTYYGPYPVDNYVDALIQYAEDTRLAPREIPLPWHEQPKHPPIYYYIDPITRQPTPRRDALICAGYLRRPWRGNERVTEASHIHPTLDRYGQPPPEVLEKKSDVYYQLVVLTEDEREELRIVICSVRWSGQMPRISYCLLRSHNFSPRWLEADED